MNTKERCLNFIKSFTNIKIRDVLKELNLNSSSFYTYEYSLDNMQKVTDEIKKRLEKICPDMDRGDIILDTKEKNVNFVKEINNIKINTLCSNLHISKQAIYRLEASDTKYELLVNDIIQRVNNIYNKYK